MRIMGDKENCPQCKSSGTIKHCSDVDCLWFICESCSKPHNVLIYDKKRRFFRSGDCVV